MCVPRFDPVPNGAPGFFMRAIRHWHRHLHAHRQILNDCVLVPQDIVIFFNRSSSTANFQIFNINRVRLQYDCGYLCNTYFQR